MALVETAASRLSMPHAGATLLDRRAIESKAEELNRSKG
jgi:hypothetical protein